MARDNSSNKAAAVRKVIESGLTKPKEVAARVQEETGLEVTAAYVSAIKNLDRKKGGSSSSGRQKSGKATGGRPVGRPRKTASAAAPAHDALTAGVDFVKRVGGLDAARQTLDQIEVIKNSL